MVRIGTVIVEPVNRLSAGGQFPLRRSGKIWKRLAVSLIHSPEKRRSTSSHSLGDRVDVAAQSSLWKSAKTAHGAGRA